MDKLLFQDEHPANRIESLRSIADSVEVMTYTDYLTPEELVERKDMLASRSIEESQINDEFQEIKDKFKAKLKPIIAEKSMLLTEIKHKSRSLNGECFKITDYNNDMVGYYDPRGKLIYERPSNESERQRTIMSVHREQKAM